MGHVFFFSREYTMNIYSRHDVVAGRQGPVPEPEEPPKEPGWITGMIVNVWAIWGNGPHSWPKMITAGNSA